MCVIKKCSVCTIFLTDFQSYFLGVSNYVKIFLVHFFPLQLSLYIKAKGSERWNDQNDRSL